jgi:hypothetical protein
MECLYTKSCDVLDTMVMRVLDSILKTAEHGGAISGQQSFAANYCTQNGLCRPLFDLIRDPILSNFSVGVFGSLSYETFRLETLEIFCLEVTETHTKSKGGADYVDPPVNKSPSEETTIVGSKRK